MKNFYYNHCQTFLADNKGIALSALALAGLVALFVTPLAILAN